MSTFEHIIVESKGAVGVITLNRPKMLNALSFGVFREIAAAVDDLGGFVVPGPDAADDRILDADVGRFRQVAAVKDPNIGQCPVAHVHPLLRHVGTVS